MTTFGLELQQHLAHHGRISTHGLLLQRRMCQNANLRLYLLFYWWTELFNVLNFHALILSDCFTYILDFSSYCWDLLDLIIDINFHHVWNCSRNEVSWCVYLYFFWARVIICCLLLLNCQFCSVPLIGTVIFAVADWCIC